MPGTALKTESFTLFIACMINLLAVSTVFMTPSIFVELAESFHIGTTQARFSFSIMSIVIWNTSLMSGIRRYGEVGVRLAIGEPKGHVYGSLLVESLMIAIIGSAIGTAVGLGFSYLLQEVGRDNPQ